MEYSKEQKAKAQDMINRVLYMSRAIQKMSIEDQMKIPLSYYTDLIKIYDKNKAILVGDPFYGLIKKPEEVEGNEHTIDNRPIIPASKQKKYSFDKELSKKVNLTTVGNNADLTYFDESIPKGQTLVAPIEENFN